ncbi:glycosyltransferase family 4 protein [Nesterenkonia flava]|uniref:Glycosyltransferase family 4 protein n=1 Tax=Nesterenkonia flava TaxID=469799 RepID=A0ABU1FS38_9MICC|nr:glycosyltransferase family 4 protein [Nesterenkonia flava]MDR5711052.1 glycosyltransferase family 4 protein [Nesterenkonia flava]
MRIAYILADPGIGIFGTKGASVHAQEMIRAFRALGHEVTVYCTKRGNKAGRPETEFVPEDLQDLPIFTVSVAGAKGAAERELAVMRAASRMAALAAEEGCELIYERYSLFSDAGVQAKQQLHARGITVPLVVEVNAPLAQEQRAHRSLHHEQLAQQITTEVFSCATVLSCVSEAVAAWAAQEAGASQDSATAQPRVVVTPNGVNTERFRPAAGGNSAFTVGFVGTLKPWHGTEILLQAFAAASAAAATETAHDDGERSPARPWQLEIVGDGPLREDLTALAAELGIRDRVVFHGAVPPQDVPQVMGRFDVATAPYPVPSDTQQHYFSPLKAYEYMAAGLPVVASEVGELPHLLSSEGPADQAAGLTVEPSNVNALADALRELAADAPRRQRLGRNARAAVVAHHSWRARAADVLGQAGVPVSDTPSTWPAGETLPTENSAPLNRKVMRV